MGEWVARQSGDKGGMIEGQPSHDWEVFLLPNASPAGSAGGSGCSGEDSISVGHNSSHSLRGRRWQLAGL